MRDLRLEQVEKMITDHNMRPVFTGQIPYIASGPDNEILVSKMSSGLYSMELLDKKQMEESLQQTIRAFEQYAAGTKP